MGNVVLNQCRTGTSQSTVINDLTNTNYPTCNTIPEFTPLCNTNTKQQQTIKLQKHTKQQQPSQNHSPHQQSISINTPKRSIQIQAIYQSLIKQSNLIINAVQNLQTIQQNANKNLQSLKNKIIHIKTQKKGEELTKISLASYQVKRINIQHMLSHFQFMKYKLQTQSQNDTSIDKIAYRERALSKSFDLNQQQIYNDKNVQQSLSKKTPSIYNHKEFHIVNKQYIYVGHVSAQNIPHGSGQLYLSDLKDDRSISNSQNASVFIQAEFTNGTMFSDDALIINQNGSYYRGGFVGQTIHGKGKLCQHDGLILQGNFVNGLLQGKAKATYSDFGKYQGHFHQGLREGQGIMTWKSQQISQTKNTYLTIKYEGYFKEDQMEGLGYLKTPNYQYWGPFVSNMKQGKGTLKFKDGRKYQGWFEKDQISGYGELHHPDGSVEKGIFPFQKQQ